MPVRASVYPAGSGTVSGTGEFVYNTFTQVQWNPNEGYADTAAFFLYTNENIYTYYALGTGFATMVRKPMPNLLAVPYMTPLPNGDNVFCKTINYSDIIMDYPRKVSQGSTFIFRGTTPDDEKYELVLYRAGKYGTGNEIGRGPAIEITMDAACMYLYCQYWLKN